MSSEKTFSHCSTSDNPPPSVLTPSWAAALCSNCLRAPHVVQLQAGPNNPASPDLPGPGLWDPICLLSPPPPAHRPAWPVIQGSFPSSIPPPVTPSAPPGTPARPQSAPGVGPQTERAWPTNAPTAVWPQSPLLRVTLPHLLSTLHPPVPTH